jgi:uncharacterized membrane protein YeaQ/YmgE (transglycosylase-associated protein family)
MNLVEKAKNIILNPKQEWEVSKDEKTTFTSLLTGYVVPLALIGAIASFIGGYIGQEILGIKIGGTVKYGLFSAISSFIGAILGYIIVTYIVDILAPTFGSEKNLDKSARLAAYSQTAGLLAAVFNAIPSLSFLTILGVYGAYVAWLGISPMKNTPENQKAGYVIAIIAATIVISFMVSFVLSATLMKAVM